MPGGQNEGITIICEFYIEGDNMARVTMLVLREETWKKLGQIDTAYRDALEIRQNYLFFCQLLTVSFLNGPAEKNFQFV